EGERVARVHDVVAKESKKAAVEVVGAGLRHDVDRGPAGSAQVSSVVGAVDLELLDAFLAHRQPDSTGVVVGLPAVHGYAVAPAVASIERETTLRRLFDPEVLVARHARGITHSRSQQREGEIVAAVDRQILDKSVGNHVGLLAGLRVHQWRLSGYLD